MDLNTLLQLLDSTIRLATPLLLACIAGLYSERAGIFDIGLEGKMLAAAMCSGAVSALVAASTVWQIPLGLFTLDLTWARDLLPPVIWGLLAGILGSLIFALIHGVTSITFRGNQLISGVALNFVASGLTVLVAQTLFRQGGRTPSLSGNARFAPIELPFAQALSDVPLIGPFYAEVVSGHSALVYAAFAIVALTWWVLYRTRFGLRLRAVGENPAAVDTAGVSVTRLRYSAVMITGVLCGIAGAYMATALQAGFGKEMTAGRGYIALAALIFAKWRPVAAMWACLLFGFFQALALRPDVVANVVPFRVPGSFIEALPYILTVLVLAGFVGKAIPPRAGGEPYVKER
ncbi:ABC transporter permease [Pseudogemmobacter sonorensis]|uniref:ABC transporter permease n=1 Tax=Pseudogemmobacter sonorensis TaxID=2989681 RepID=UPI00367BE2CF